MPGRKTSRSCNHDQQRKTSPSKDAKNDIPSIPSWPRITEIKASNGYPSLQFRRLELRKISVPIFIAGVGWDSGKTMGIDLGECIIQMSVIIRVDLAWRYSIANTVPRVGSLIVADGSTIRRTRSCIARGSRNDCTEAKLGESIKVSVSGCFQIASLTIKLPFLDTESSYFHQGYRSGAHQSSLKVSTDRMYRSCPSRIMARAIEPDLHRTSLKDWILAFISSIRLFHGLVPSDAVRLGRTTPNNKRLPEPECRERSLTHSYSIPIAMLRERVMVLRLSGSYTCLEGGAMCDARIGQLHHAGRGIEAQEK